MSYAYRIDLKESQIVSVEGKDTFTTCIELVDVLPAQAMRELLEQKLAEAGFRPEADHMVKVDGHTSVTVNLSTREVEVSALRGGERQVEVTVSHRGEDHAPVSAEERLQRQELLRQQLDQKLQTQTKIAETLMEKSLREEATAALREAIPRLAAELGCVSHAVQAAALETKARSMGTVERVEHDPDSQSMTIVIKLG